MGNVRVEVKLIEEISVKNGEFGIMVQVSGTVPSQDENLPCAWEKLSQSAGLQLMRKLFGFGIEKSDLELLLSLRSGKNGEGIVRNGKRAYTFKTIFGTVAVPRIRIKYKESGITETPSSRVWKLPRQVYISQGLKVADCNLVVKQSFSSTVRQLEIQTGQPKIISKGTVCNILICGTQHIKIYVAFKNMWRPVLNN